jgi:hypothetical protein
LHNRALSRASCAVILTRGHLKKKGVGNRWNFILFTGELELLACWSTFSMPTKGGLDASLSTYIVWNEESPGEILYHFHQIAPTAALSDFKFGAAVLELLLLLI